MDQTLAVNQPQVCARFELCSAFNHHRRNDLITDTDRRRTRAENNYALLAKSRVRQPCRGQQPGDGDRAGSRDSDSVDSGAGIAEFILRFPFVPSASRLQYVGYVPPSAHTLECVGPGSQMDHQMIRQLSRHLAKARR